MYRPTVVQFSCYFLQKYLGNSARWRYSYNTEVIMIPHILMLMTVSDIK